MFDAIFMMGGLGLIIGSCLAAASKIFYVYVDPKILQLESILPGANCGGCGFPGCGANAEAIVAGQSPPTSCVAGNAELAQAIAALMGMSFEAKEPDIARPGCTYGTGEAAMKYEYAGLSDCQAVSLLYGGMKVCNIGCLGLGSCMRACPFNAITMGSDGLPVVDEKRCTGCGTCERVCPKHIIKLSSVTRRILKEYATDDCTTPCQRACPAGIDIASYIRHMDAGNYSKAVQVIKERNPFPTVIGRICPRPCETECRRNLVDEPVGINNLKRYAADYEMKRNERSQPFKAPETQRKVAVIGGGVEGLSAAFFAARLGHSPTVFEATPKLGGLLRKAIAQYRLPADILDWDIEGVRELGVEMTTNMILGRDFTIASLLKNGYEAILLASGGWDSRTERQTDAQTEKPVPGVYLLIDLIRTGLDNGRKLNIGSDVVIAGGGEIASRAANICRHLGAHTISVVFRTPRAECGLTEDQILALEAEGANVMFNAGITRLIGEEDRLTAIEYQDLAGGSTYVISAGNLIIDSGRLPEMIFRKIDTATSEEEGSSPAKSDEPVRWEGIQPYKNPAYSEEKGLLSGGDPITDYSAAIRAIAGGRRSAASLHMIMYGLDLKLPENVITLDTVVQRIDHLENVEPKARNIMPVCAPADVTAKCPEIELGYSEEAARSEAARCLKCGVICYMADNRKQQQAS